MAEIAVPLDTALRQRDHLGQRGATRAHVIADGPGWRVADVICTCGPQDARYEEQHREHAVAFVLEGIFEQHGADGRVLMTPGATMLGNPTARFECSHSHSAGDRCVAFWFSEEYFGRMLGDVKRHGWSDHFGVAALPALAATAALVTQVARALATRDIAPWDEIAACAATNTFRLTHQSPWTPSPVSSRAESSIAEAIQIIEAAPEAPTSLDAMAQRASMSPYHFLRVFNARSGLTPHQYVRRARLRRAAERLLAERTPIIDVALDSGFGDVSNFNRSFRAEFGVSPRAFRRKR